MTFPEALQCGYRLHKARKASSSSVRELAGQVGISVHTWLEHERGNGWERMWPETMEKFAGAVGIPVNDLVPAEIRRAQ